jgi:hypothetical protein
LGNRSLNVAADRRRILPAALLVAGAFLLVPALVLSTQLVRPLATAIAGRPAAVDWHIRPQPERDVATHASGLWPLKPSCFDAVADGRKPTAEDRRILGDPHAVVVAAYPVRAGRLAAPTEGQALACHQQLWKVIQSVYPGKELAMLDRLVVFEAPADDDLEGEVWPDDAKDTRWTLAVTLVDMGDLGLAHTLVHELGHLLSLNTTEVDPAPEPADGCATYDTGGGCSLPGSILDDYTANTWGESLLGTWYDIDAITDDKKRDKALADLYAKNEADFVDPYAATDPDEDFAETFAYWCLREPLLTPPLERKAEFMTHRTELQPMRARCQAIFG